MQDEIICYCREVLRSSIEKAIAEGAKTLGDIRRMTGACSGVNCATMNPKGVCCAEDIQKILREKLPSPCG